MSRRSGSEYRRLVQKRPQLGARRRENAAERRARQPNAIEEMRSHRAEFCLEPKVVGWLFLLISMQKIAPSPLEFTPICGRRRGWN